MRGFHSVFSGGLSQHFLDVFRVGVIGADFQHEFELFFGRDEVVGLLSSLRKRPRILGRVLVLLGAQLLGWLYNVKIVVLVRDNGTFE